MTEQSEKPENQRLCKECGVNPTIQPSSPYCASCLARKANEAKAKKQGNALPPRTEKKEQEDQTALKKEKGPTQTMQRSKIVDSRADLSLTLHFGNYRGLLDSIKKEAEKEVRSIEGQAIYILKAFFSDREGNRSL